MAARWSRPTVDTKFHIDLQWWEEQEGRDLRVYMREALCGECRDEYAGMEDLEAVGWVDDETGEGNEVDALLHSIRTCCGIKRDYITPNSPVVDAVFRTFLANGNKPLSMKELYELLDRRPPHLLLRIFTGGQVYMGIRPVR